jgi:hypothetical protein
VRSRGYGRPWGQYFGLLVLGLGTVALIYLALTRTGDDAPAEAVDTPSSSVSGSTPTEGPSESGAGDPSESATDDPGDDPSLSTTPPTVPDQRRADFSAGDKLPDGALLVDGGGNESGLTLTGKGLTHGPPTSGNLAAGVLEVELEKDVRALGFRVRFAAGNPGAVTLVAWQTSIGAAIESGSQVAPNSGFRLVATPGEWTLSVLDGTESTLAEGTYDASAGAETFQIVREGEQVWVIDPTGATTTATDPRVASLAGPWASWGLQESAVGEKPALIEAVWGG